MEYYPYEITFYPHNFQDINTFYLQCVNCGFKQIKSINKIGVRVSKTTQRVRCGNCSANHHFDVEQMCLTFVLKFFPDEPLVKDIILVNGHYASTLNTSNQIKTDAYNIFHNYIKFLEVLEAS